MRIRDERLPWLTDEPGAATTAAPRTNRDAATRGGTGRLMWPWYLLLLLLVAGVAVGAWWLGTRQRQVPPPQLPVEAPVGIPVPASGPPPSAGPQPAAEEPIAGEQPLERPTRPAEALPRPSIASSSRVVPEPAPEPEQSDQQDESPSLGRSVFPADEPAAAPPPVTGPVPIVVHHPQKYRGRVIQLGAFPTRAQADAAWRRAVRRYPYLATKPKMVNTVDVRAIGSGRGTRMYRLQLGTSSQAQSAVICQQLARAGQSCVVVY